jgi:hypothetical protein
MVSRTGSIRVLTPNPHRADHEVDCEPGTDSDQVREQIEHAEPGENLDDAHVDRENAQRGEAEAGVPECGQVHPLERPHLVEYVVVRGGDLDGHDCGGQ